MERVGVQVFLKQVACLLLRLLPVSGRPVDCLVISVSFFSTLAFNFIIEQLLYMNLNLNFLHLDPLYRLIEID